MEFIESNNCPYCGAHLRKIPKKEGKCPECGQLIIRMTNPTDYQEMLITVDEKRRIESDRDKYIIEKYRKYFTKELGFDDHVFEVVKEDLGKKFKQPPSDKDVLWHSFNLSIRALNEKKDWRTISKICLMQAQYLRDDGKKPNSALKSHFQYILKDLKQKRVEMVTLSPTRQTRSHQSCSNCVNSCAQNPLLSFDEACQIIDNICDECTCDDFESDACLCIEELENS